MPWPGDSADPGGLGQLAGRDGQVQADHRLLRGEVEGDDHRCRGPHRTVRVMAYAIIPRCQ